MTQQVVIVPAPPPRECLVIEGKRYCRDEDTPPAEVGALIIMCVVLIAWMGWPMYDHVEGGDRMGWTPLRAVAWYAGPPLLLALFLVLQ